MPKPQLSWEEQILDAIRDAAGPGAAEELQAEWSEHEALHTPVVTLFGSYDSGKSTLLKRLLVDADLAVPDWLTIAARRDTFEVNEVDAIGCRFRDTPGIASGNVEHERLARQALTTTDAIVVVLPPQLLTGDREAVLSVVAGEVFRSGGLVLGEALAFALCKMDEGGYDPLDDAAAYHGYLEGKRNEMLDILKTVEVEQASDRVFAVAADPFQTVVNTKNPGRSAYDPYRDWDGISDLQGWIESLPTSLKALRSLARKRFLCAGAEAHRAAATQRASDVEIGLEESRANEERFTLLGQQIETLLGQARSTLDAAVEEELLTAARARLDDKASIENFVGPRLEKAVARWWDDQTAELDKLIVSADAEVEARSRSRGEKKSRQVFEEDFREGNGKKGNGRKKLTSLAEKAQKALRDHHERSMGMKLEKAREELKKVDEAKTFGEYLVGAKRRKSFRSLAEAQHARKLVIFHTVVGTLGPLLIELGTMLWEEKHRRDLEKKRAEKRQKLRDAVRKTAEKLGEETWKEWKVRADHFQAWLSQHKQAAHAMSEPQQEELRLLKASAARLAQVLSDAV